MTNTQRLILLFVACAICVALGVYYLVPGVYHPLTFSASPTSAHWKHSALFFGLAVIGLIASRFLTGGKASKARY